MPRNRGDSKPISNRPSRDASLRDQERLRQVAIEDGKAAEFVRAESGADLGAIDLEERRVGTDFDFRRGLL